MVQKIAIQGVEGAFHHIAAKAYFNQPFEIICCNTFAEVFDTIEKEENTLGLVAIENTIAGSLLPNYELLRKSKTQIIGEHKLHIEHSLMCLPEDSLESIQEVNSHPVALMQCQDYLRKHPHLKMVESFDTAGAAQMIKHQNLKGHACICHRDVAKLYNLKLLATAIEDNKHNFTRFLVLAPQEKANLYNQPEKNNKSSLVFSLHHSEGSLSQVLSVFSFYALNLTKIQSLPIIGREWEYLFYVDITFDNYQRFLLCIEAVKPLVYEINCLGVYEGK